MDIQAYQHTAQDSARAKAPTDVAAQAAGARVDRVSVDPVPSRDSRSDATASMPPVERETAQQVADDAQKEMDRQGVKLSFNVQEDNETVQVEVRDTETGKVVRKIPADEVIKLSESIKQFAGRFLDKTS